MNKVLVAALIAGGALLVFAFLAAGILTLIAGGSSLAGGNVALITISGTIVTEDSFDIFPSEVTVSEDIVEFIDKAEKDPLIRAILFEINSPGGSAVASQEIGNAIKKSKKLTVAVIRDVGASGGYWVASATDHIIANPMSITGSIGVISSYLDFSGFLTEHNVTYQRLVSGPYKDIGSPLRKLSPEEVRLLQRKLDMIHGYFVDEVAKNRNLPKDSVETLATGIFYLGSEAKELGLVDELGDRQAGLDYIRKTQKIEPVLVEYEAKKGLFELLNRVGSQAALRVGTGIGNVFFSSQQLPITAR